MYNRYVQQQDGSYRKNRMQEQPPKEPAPSIPDPPAPPPRSRGGQSADSFLRQLLPQDLDTGDLLIVILLLLMAGDCGDDRNTALLTLALYLFV